MSHVEKELRYSSDEWTHVACSWKTGEHGFLRLYVNGAKVAEVARNSGAAYPPSGVLYLGTDKGSSNLAGGRFADGDFDELAFFGRTLGDDEVMCIFDEQNPNPPHAPGLFPDGTLVETRAVFDENGEWMVRQAEVIQKAKAAGFKCLCPVHLAWQRDEISFILGPFPAECGFLLGGPPGKADPGCP